MTFLSKSTPYAAKVRRYESRQAKRAAKLTRDKAALAAWREVSAAVKARDGGLCRVCHQPTQTTGHPGRIGSAHHLIYRSHGRDDSLDNLIHLCGRCHADIHAALVRVRGTSDHLLVEDDR